MVFNELTFTSGAMENYKFKVQHLDISSEDSIHSGEPQGFSSNYAVHSTPSPGDAATDSPLIPRKEQHSPSPPPSSSGYEVPFAASAGQCNKLRSAELNQASPQKAADVAKEHGFKYQQDVASSNSAYSVSSDIHYFHIFKKMSMRSDRSSSSKASVNCTCEIYNVVVKARDF